MYLLKIKRYNRTTLIFHQSIYSIIIFFEKKNYFCHVKIGVKTENGRRPCEHTAIKINHHLKGEPFSLDKCSFF